MPKISVLIVNYNAGERLRRCLECLRVQTFQDFETILIDNGSTDTSLEHAGKSELPLRLIKAGENLGFAAGNNRATKAASGEWLAFLNPDAYAKPDWLEKLLAATERYPTADAFGSTQLRADDPHLIDGAGDVYHIFGLYYRGHYGWPVEKLPGDGECFSPCAAAALYRRAVFEELGGFDESFFCYGEDVDLGFRLRLAGGHCVQVADAMVLHEGSGLTGRHSDFAIYHGHRNRAFVTYKNMPSTLYWAFAPARGMMDLVLFMKMLTLGAHRPYLRALRDARAGRRAYRAARRQIQSARKISSLGLLPFLTFSPLKLFRREAVLRKMSGA